MKPRLIHAVFVAVSLLLSLPALAAVVTVDVTIKSINPQARGITVVYKTELGEKSIELDVSRRAEVTLNGKEATLDSLGSGLKAKVSFDRELAIVTKIEASGVVVKQKPPELVEVSELNDANFNMVGCLSEDGLTVYWVQGGNSKKHTIWTAHRDDPQSLFTNKKELFQGFSPTVSADGLEMILTAERSDSNKGPSLYVTTRSAPGKAWVRPQEIPELAKFIAFQPCLSYDGLTLYFVQSTEDFNATSLVQVTRKDRSSAWSNPKPVHNVVDSGSPFVTPDGLNLLCSHGRPNETGEKGSLMVWSRPAIGRPFLKGKYIEPDNLPPLFGNFPRYVAATNELFFSRTLFENKKPVRGKSSIWVVKNFTLPKGTQ